MCESDHDRPPLRNAEVEAESPHGARERVVGDGNDPLPRIAVDDAEGVLH
jgi:hypothetical protein